MRHHLTVAALVLFSSTAFAQAPSLDVPVHNFQLPRQLPECGLQTVLLRFRTSVDFRGGTVLDALNSLVQLQPAMWYASSNGERLFVDVWFAPTNDGFGVAPLISALTRP